MTVGVDDSAARLQPDLARLAELCATLVDMSNVIAEAAIS